jgi:PRTRC genetic system ThiF family protein
MNEVIVHKLPEHMTHRPWRVVVIGAGGTGSAVLPALARLHHAMMELGHPGGIECTVYDDDVVSQTNVGRQGFYPNDVGSFKASLIVNRLNMLMGTNWRAITERLNGRTSLFNVDLVIGCVDTRAARLRQRHRPRAGHPRADEPSGRSPEESRAIAARWRSLPGSC